MGYYKNGLWFSGDHSTKLRNRGRHLQEADPPGTETVRQGLKMVADGGALISKGLRMMTREQGVNPQQAVHIKGLVDQDIHKIVRYVLDFLSGR